MTVKHTPEPFSVTNGIDTEAYQTSQTAKREVFAKLVNKSEQLTTLQKAPSKMFE